MVLILKTDDLMPDVGSTTGAMSQLIGMADTLQRTVRFRFGKNPHFSTTRNTTHQCQVCYSNDRSWRAVAWEHSDGMVRLHHCMRCNGTGEVKQ